MTQNWSSASTNRAADYPGRNHRPPIKQPVLCPSGIAGYEKPPALRQIGSQKHMDRFVADARAGQLAGHGAMGVDDTALLRFVVPAAD